MNITRGRGNGAVKPIFDVNKAKITIEKGRRAKWWIRKGTMKRGFSYLDANGNKISDETHLDRIRLLVIPPAWKHVRISPFAGSSLQVVGMDTTGRAQYLYNSRFAEKRQRQKFSKLEKFGEFLPHLRRATNEHIALDGFPREKVLAVMMRLINSLYIRIGTDKSVKHYKTFGITTLQNKHFTIGKKDELIFEFVGKSHVKHRKMMVDKDLAAVMQELKQLGGARRLFHYVGDDGKAHTIKPSEVNTYIKNATSPLFSSKDFRTWGGTLMAAIELAEIGIAEEQSVRAKNIGRAVKKVAEQLGNTPSVCRGSYIHPAILKAYESGTTIDEFRPRGSRKIQRIGEELELEEKALLRLLNVVSSGSKS